MTDQLRKPDWILSFEREAAIKRVLILEGNVQDIFYDQNQREYVGLPELLARILETNEKLSFTLNANWDQSDGLRFRSDKQQADFEKILKDNQPHRQQTDEQSYDIGPEQNQNDQNNQLYTDPSELMSVVRQVFSGQQHRAVFILDYTQHLVTQPDHPDPNERSWIRDLKKSIGCCGTVKVNSDSLKYNNGLLIFLTTSLGSIPPAIYQSDPRIKVITVPNPSRCQRKDFFLRHIDDLKCQPPKSSSKKPSESNFTADSEELADILADTTDELRTIDLKQLTSLSITTENPLPPEKLINLYKLGDQRSPWEDLSQEKLRKVEDILKDRVIGQDEAVNRAATMMIRAYLGLAGLQHSGKRSKPKGVLFFVGPTGVGKTELAKAIAEFLFGDESAFIRFDMSEYNHEHSDQKLIGAPPGYVGFEQGGQLTNAVRQKPFSVILFDEIEKAHGRILDKFLQILEDGRLTDSRGETVYFSESVIIFTSNIGASDMPDSDDKEVIKQHFISAVSEHFDQLKRPEILNRLGDNIVSFNKITDNSFRKSILKKKAGPLEAHLRERFGVSIKICDDAHESFLNGSNSNHGGRGLLNSMERMLINPLSRFVFDHMHQLRKGRQIAVSIKNDNINFEIQEQSDE